jgi:hypothetical protein
MTSMANIFLELERKFWLQGAGFYRENLSEESIMLFPGAGLMRRAEIIEGIEKGPRWREVRIHDEHLLDLGPDARLLCYQVTARRDGEAPYSALASSTYVRRDNTWRLIFHQQSPLG